MMLSTNCSEMWSTKSHQNVVSDPPKMAFLEVSHSDRCSSTIVMALAKFMDDVIELQRCCAIPIGYLSHGSTLFEEHAGRGLHDVSTL